MCNQLDVFLRCSRNYVQGTQLIARSGELVAPEAKFSSAAFSRITDRVVLATSADGISSTQTSIGSVSYLVHDETIKFHLVESAIEAPRRDEPMTFSMSLMRQFGPLRAEYRFENVNDFESILNAVVQTTKDLHERLGETIQDVWFTGARGFSLELGYGLHPTCGIIRLTGGRVMRREKQYQSMVRVELLSLEHKTRTEGNVLFAFKSEEAVNVS